MAIQDIGERVGLSTNPCWRRIKQMEAAGVIEGRIALVDAAALGLKTTAFVAIRTSQHDPKWVAAFARAVRQVPEIVECHRMSGDIDYLLKVMVRDIQHYDQVYQRLIALAPALSDVSSTFSMEKIKFDVRVPLSACA